MKAPLRILTLIVLASLGLGSPAFAAKKHAKREKHVAVKSYDLLAAKPLDEVFKHLDQVQKKIHNAHARALTKAYDRLEAKQYAKARGLAQPVLGDALFSDYAHWIIASAWQAEGESLPDSKKNLKQIASAGKAAFQHFQAVEDGNSYSPLTKLAPKQLGEAELLIAYGTSPSAESVRTFEDAFERLSVHNGGISGILPEQTESFSNACEKHPNDLCEPWLLRLQNHFKSGPSAAHATQPYHSGDLDLAAFDDAMESCFSAKWSDAVGKLQKFLDEFPKSTYRFRARYWLSRSLLEKSKEDEAKKELASLQQDSPLSYYGLLSALATKHPMDAPISDAYPVAAERDPGLTAAETFHLGRAEIFLAQKGYDLAGMELKELRPRGSLTSPFLMYLAGLNYRAQSYPMLFTLLSELIQRNYDGIASSIGLKMIFPVVQMDKIRKHAKENGLDPVLVLSLIKQESAFDTHALSGSGAAGLMQIMYFTAVETMPGINRTDLLEPEHNIKTGTRYLAKLLERFHGNVVLALAAYNAGPIPVERWVREAVKQKYGMLQFIESIPYHETRDYVSSIIRNYFWYSKILKNDMPKSLSYFWAPYGDLNKEIGGPDVSAVLTEPSPAPTPTASRD